MMHERSQCTHTGQADAYKYMHKGFINSKTEFFKDEQTTTQEHKQVYKSLGAFHEDNKDSFTLR